MADKFWRDQVIQGSLQRDVDDAFREQQDILFSDPRNPQAHFALGTLAHFMGKTQEAIDYFRKAIEYDPAYAAPHVSLGRIHAVRGDFELAWKHARAAEELGSRELVELFTKYPKALGK
jgi:tetratricopeptide (TPR) repeat protein